MNSMRTIPSLDGLRALSILLVILCHVQFSLQHGEPSVFVARTGSLGVNMFFVISGFLITHLLVSEADRKGSIGFGRFYQRRAFRILPPFYVYLAVAAIIRVRHPAAFTWSSFFSAATFVWNFNPHADGWLIGQTWSLSLEEQFYLFWPAVIAFLPRRACLRVAAAIVLVSPVLRVATYFLFPMLRGHIDAMLPTHLDTMMVGCFLALATNLNAFTALRAALTQPIWAALCVPCLFIFCPLLEEKYRGAFYLPAGITITSVCCGIILVYAVTHSDSLFGRFLNLSWLRHIGVISYSLYLWQQMFTGPATRSFPLNLVWIGLCAELSYWLVERPSLRLRDRLMRRPAPLSARKATAFCVPESTS